MNSSRLVFTIILFFVICNSVNAVTSITDNFTDGDYTTNPTWTVTQGSFAVVANRLTDTAFPGNSQLQTSISQSSVRDFNFYATINATSVSSTGYIGLVKRSTGNFFAGGDFNGYAVLLAFGGANNFQLAKYDSGVKTVLYQTTKVVSTGTDYKIGAQRIGNSLSIYYNGVLESSVNDFNHFDFNALAIQWTPGATANKTDDINLFIPDSAPVFRIMDEETQAPLQATLTINNIPWYVSPLGIFDVNNQITFPATFELSMTNYDDRTFTFDSNAGLYELEKFGLRNSDEAIDIDFIFYGPDESTIISNQMILVKNVDAISGRAKTNSLGQVTLNLAPQDTNYVFLIKSSGDDSTTQYTYYSVPLIINQPIDEVTHVSITPNNFSVIIGGLGLQSYTGTLPTTAILILNNTVDTYSINVVDSNSNGQQYFARNYIAQVLGDISSVTINPYLIKLTDGINVNFVVKNISDERTLPDIRITAKTIVSDLVTVEDQLTNAVGTSIFTLISKKDYPITVTSPNTDVNYFSGTITASHDSFTFWINYDTSNYGGSNNDINVTFTPVAQYIQSETQIVNAIVSASFPISSVALYGLDNNALIDFNQISTSPYSINIDLNVLEYDNNVALIRLDVVPLNDNNISFYQTYYFGIPRVDVIEQFRLLKNNFSIISLFVLVIVIILATIVLLGSSIFGNNDSQLFVIATVAGILWLIFFQEYSKVFIVASIIGVFAWLWTRSAK